MNSCLTDQSKIHNGFILSGIENNNSQICLSNCNLVVWFTPYQIKLLNYQGQVWYTRNRKDCTVLLNFIIIKEHGHCLYYKFIHYCVLYQISYCKNLIGTKVLVRNKCSLLYGSFKGYQLKNIYETSKDNVICLFPNLIVTYSCF